MLDVMPMLECPSDLEIVFSGAPSAYASEAWGVPEIVKTNRTQFAPSN